MYTFLLSLCVSCYTPHERVCIHSYCSVVHFPTTHTNPSPGLELPDLRSLTRLYVSIALFANETFCGIWIQISVMSKEFGNMRISHAIPKLICSTMPMILPFHCGILPAYRDHFSSWVHYPAALLVPLYL